MTPDSAYVFEFPNKLSLSIKVAPGSDQRLKDELNKKLTEISQLTNLDEIMLLPCLNNANCTFLLMLLMPKQDKQYAENFSKILDYLSVQTLDTTLKGAVKLEPSFLPHLMRKNLYSVEVIGKILQKASTAMIEKLVQKALRDRDPNRNKLSEADPDLFRQLQGKVKDPWLQARLDLEIPAPQSPIISFSSFSSSSQIQQGELAAVPSL